MLESLSNKQKEKLPGSSNKNSQNTNRFELNLKQLLFTFICLLFGTFFSIFILLFEIIF